MEYNQVTELPLNINSDICSGKTYIVTGANVGLGLEACRHLVSAHAKKVIMAVRNIQAGEAARADIEGSTGIKGVAEVWNLDLAKPSSVQSFADKAIESLDRIDALIENAGVAHTERMDDGDDAKAFGFKPRVAVLTSDSALALGEYWPVVADDCIAKINADQDIGMKGYPASKLLDILGVKHLGALLPLEPNGVVINAVNPGVCVTELSRNASEAFRQQLRGLWAKCGRTAECGSRTLLAGAVAGEDSHGKYMNDCAIKNDMPSWIDSAAAEQAWASIEKEIEKVHPGAVSKAFE